MTMQPASSESDPGPTRSSPDSFIPRWILTRIVGPLLTFQTLWFFSGHMHPHERELMFFWTLFVVHIMGVLTAAKTDVLDIGAYILLMPAIVRLTANPAREFSHMHWVTPAVFSLDTVC